MPSDSEMLGHEIIHFLSVHGKKSAQDPWQWNSPDGHQLEDAAVLLMNGMDLDRIPFSDWSSGGYQPYNDQKAREWHDRLVQRTKEFVRMK